MNSWAHSVFDLLCSRLQDAHKQEISVHSQSFELRGMDISTEHDDKFHSSSGSSTQAADQEKDHIKVHACTHPAIVMF